jgi:hypothetical protein
VDDLCVSPFMRSLSAGRNACLVRILVTISPRLYREVLALSIHRRRPDFEVLLAPPWPLDGRALAEGVLCRIRILLADRVDAKIELDGTASEVHDVCLEDLFEVLEEAEMLSQGDGGG